MNYRDFFQKIIYKCINRNIFSSWRSYFIFQKFICRTNIST